MRKHWQFPSQNIDKAEYVSETLDNHLFAGEWTCCNSHKMIIDNNCQDDMSGIHSDLMRHIDHLSSYEKWLPCHEITSSK